MPKYGNIDGRPTEHHEVSESFAMPGTNGGISAKLTKHIDVEYVLPKEKATRPDYTVKEIQLSKIDKRKFDENFDKIDWSVGPDTSMYNSSPSRIQLLQPGTLAEE